jgi:redox-sensitive bicupin YhaK (pirin superfamily)
VTVAGLVEAETTSGASPGSGTEVSTMDARPVRRVITAQETVEGGGFRVRRPFPVVGLEQLDPFLLLDEMGPTTYAPGAAVGAPTHPHRGFETVTFLFEGSMEHIDSAGHRGVLEAGDVQWMTAGAGVLHSEEPTPELLEQGGRVHGVQLWVNLPAARKMVPPRYQGFTADQLPVAVADEGRVRATVVAGEAFGVTGPVETTSPVTYLRVAVAPGGRFEQPVADGHTALVYVLEGELEGGVTKGQLVEYERTSGPIRVASEGGAEVLVLTGAPLREPIARYGPFVMNTRAELVQAFEDYERGTLATTAPTGS